jgi:exodeoxyribonuclease VII large subunit
MEQISLTWEPARRTFTVAELNRALGDLLRREFRDVWVAGEISGLKTSSNGHLYFVLKDRTAQIRCVCFRTSARLLKFRPADGMAVVARGRVEVFEVRGDCQLAVEVIEPQGEGALQLAFEQLKRKLAADGLFEPDRKRALPRLPRRIGIVTSPSGAVIRDLLEILTRRFPGVWIRLYPTPVQGAGSVEGVVGGLDYFSRGGWAEVVIVGRGGGSIEDLWTFNEEAVARAIARCSVPVVSAVGHETDFTIADFVADLRAPTPSAAAELVVPTREALLDQVDAGRHKLAQWMRYRIARLSARLSRQGVDRARAVVDRLIARHQQRVDDCEFRSRDAVRAGIDGRRRRLEELAARLRGRDPRIALSRAHQRLGVAGFDLEHFARQRLAAARSRLDPLAARLATLSPLAVLDRGYAIVIGEDGRVVRRASEAPAGSTVEARLAEGRIKARVVESL